MILNQTSIYVCKYREEVKVLFLFHRHPPLIYILVAIVEQRSVDDDGVAKVFAEGSEGFQGSPAGFVVVQAADEGLVLAEVRERPGGIRHRVQDADVGRWKLKVVLGEPGEEVEEALEDGHGVGHRSLREVADHVDGRVTAFRRAFEARGRLEGEAAGVVGEADVVVGSAVGPAPEDDVLAVAGDDVLGDTPRRGVLQQVRRTDVRDHQDTTRERFTFFVLSFAGVTVVQRGRQPAGLRKRQDELRRLVRRTAAAFHDEVDIAAAGASTVVVPDVPIRLDVERSILVLAER